MVRRLIEAPDLKKKRDTPEIPEEKKRNISDLSSIISDIVSARAELDKFNKDFGSVSQLQSKINQFSKSMAEVVSKLSQTDTNFGAFASEITLLQRELKSIQGKFDKVAKEVTKKVPEPTK